MHTIVSQDDANLETTETRSEDAMSGSFAHTEMTRDGNFQAELMTICSRLGISDEVAQDLLTTLEQRGILPSLPHVDRFDESSLAGESKALDRMQQGMSEEQARATCRQIQEQGVMPATAILDVRSEIAMPRSRGQYLWILV